MINEENLDGLRKVCDGAKVMPESGIDYIFLPELEVITTQTSRKIDALLCPAQHPSGYMTRLFLAEPFPGSGQSNNWTQHRILERNWHSWSWQNVPATQSPAQILAAHLRALR
ncbi:hypothetical protein HC024_21765 [Methylococcaceae bacterium WWC4]|nr:hypothetical protein [Methylococcaceae bacterium WWC4]